MRVGFEGFGLQAKPRPAGCRRIPLSPPEINKNPAFLCGVFYLWINLFGLRFTGGSGLFLFFL